MKGKLILLLIFTYTAVSRFFLLNKIPPYLNSSVINGRLLSATANIISVVMIFFLVKHYWKNTKIALLTAWVFSILPWTIEQSRIISQPNMALFSILLLLAFTKRYLNSFTSREYFHLRRGFGGQVAHPRGAFRALLLYLLIPLIMIFVYPQFWLYKAKEITLSINSFLNNFFIMLSPDFLFFKNITFWWGGVREVGIMYLGFLPFFLLGLYELIRLKRVKILLLLLIITFLSAASPFFPESREFYLATPFIAIIISIGLYRFFQIPPPSGEPLPFDFAQGERVTPEVSTPLNLLLVRWILLLLVLSVLVYEMAQFFHYYTIHYPQQILSNLSKINEPF